MDRIKTLYKKYKYFILVAVVFAVAAAWAGIISNPPGTTGFIVKKTQPFFTSQQKELGNLNGYIEEMVSGQKVVLLFSEEEQVKEEFSKINKSPHISKRVCCP